MKCLKLFLLFIAITGAAQAAQLSDSSRISLITCAPGEELYSSFGHTAIRVTDFTQNIDEVYNYGTFDYEKPGFYPNFVKGDMMYELSHESMRNFMMTYIYESRSVYEQQLSFTADERRKIYDYLQWNALPENVEYRYDFFWDNCCTRPRDIFERQLGTRLQYNYSAFDTGFTMRQALKPYVVNKPWVDFGFDLILGMPCEIRATARNQTFLPDKLQMLMDNATVDGKPFVIARRTLLSLPSPQQPFTGITPLFAMFTVLFFGLGVTVIERIKKTHFWVFDFLLLLLTGLMGTNFLLLGIFTTHYSLPWNLNILWLLPTHLLIAPLLVRKRKPKWLKYYFIAVLVLMLVLLTGWKWNPQPYNLAVIPLILLLAARSLKIYLRLKETEGA